MVEVMSGAEYQVATPLAERATLRLARLREHRDRLMADAARQLAALDAAIAEIEALLDPDAARQRILEAQMAAQNGRERE